MFGFLGGALDEMELKMSSRSSMPAFRATKSRRECQAWTWAKAEERESQFEASVRMYFVVSVGVKEVGGGLMSSIATAKDFERRCWVSARPMPDEAPVTIATGGIVMDCCC